MFGTKDFRRIFVAEIIGLSGNQLTMLAVPIVAIIALRASTTQVAVLGAMSTVSFLVVGLPAGAWVDRVSKKRVMIVADLARGAALSTVPIAWALGTLTLWHLYVVVLVIGTGTVFFDVAAMSMMPTVVSRDRLVDANTKLGALTATSEIAGQGLGGLLISALSAPAALVVDVVSYGWSALWLRGVRASEIRSAAPAGQTLGAEILAGVRHIVASPPLRVIAVEGALLNLSFQVCLTILPVVVLRTLGGGPAALGAYLALGSVGVFMGSLVARRLADALGYGPALWKTGLVLAPAALVVPYIGHGPLFWLSLAGWFLLNFRTGVNTVLKVSLRQQDTPDHLLGRMNAAFRLLLTGALALGAGLVALLSTVGVSDRVVLWVGSLGAGLTWLCIFLSGLKTRAQLGTPSSPRRTE